jgi:hypothetical protein
MLDYFKQTLVGQYEASLAMFNQCLAACPEEHWDGKIANGPFRWVAYHTLFFTDLYLTPTEHQFTLRDLHQRGGDEREPVASSGLSKEDTLSYVPICRQKVHESIADETAETLAGPSGFSWYPCTRGELHVISIRHIQHHAGQLSAYVRRVNPIVGENRRALPWVATGWR